MRQNLMLNQQRSDRAEVVPDETEEYCEAADGFHKDAKEPLGFVRKGVSRRTSERVARREQDKCILRKVSSESLEAIAK